MSDHSIVLTEDGPFGNPLTYHPPEEAWRVSGGPGGWALCREMGSFSWVSGGTNNSDLIGAQKLYRSDTNEEIQSLDELILYWNSIGIKAVKAGS